MIRFQPFYQATIWGGRRLADEFDRQLPAGPIGESWELIDLGTKQSMVVAGPFAGKSLGELWRAGALGGSAQGNFPFIVKWIDAKQRVSIQVHPDEEACKSLSNAQPKTEAWFVAQADPKSSMLLGHYLGLDPSTLKQAVAGGTLQKWLYEVRLRTGDMVLVPGGMIHSIGAGMLLLEVQQPSDTTFRIYDWGRLGLDGYPRPLHHAEASVAINYKQPGPPKVLRQALTGPSFAMKLLQVGSELSAEKLGVLVADSGAIKVDTERGEEIVEYGEVVVTEPADGHITLMTGTCLLLTEPA